MSIKAKDNELFYIGCLICREIEALESLSVNSGEFAYRFEYLVNLKNKWSNLVLQDK